MESQRLKPMPLNYNQELFNEIYNATRGLRYKLASNIDHKRLGFEFKDILYFFDEKLIFAFTKYYHIHTPDVLKGHIISALNMYQYRLMKMAYSPKYNQYNITHMEDKEDFEQFIPIDIETSKEMRDAGLNFMEQNLSRDAWLLLKIELYPPIYIMNKLKTEKTIYKMKPEHILDYLDLPINAENILRIKKLKKEINDTTKKAREYFSQRAF